MRGVTWDELITNLLGVQFYYTPFYLNDSGGAQLKEVGLAMTLS